jgi:hypothetical protein
MRTCIVSGGGRLEINPSHQLSPVVVTQPTHQTFMEPYMPCAARQSVNQPSHHLLNDDRDAPILAGLTCRPLLMGLQSWKGAFGFPRSPPTMVRLGSETKTHTRHTHLQ